MITSDETVRGSQLNSYVYMFQKILIVTKERNGDILTK